MSCAAVLLLCLWGQTPYSIDDSVNQWESHLLEAKWTLTEPETGAPRLLLVLRCLKPDQRVFELYMYDRWGVTDVQTVEAWTGTYRMESREDRRREVSEKFVRLEFEQHWWPVDMNKIQRVESWMGYQGYHRWLAEGDAAHWTEHPALLDWTEELDFKTFFAEFKINAAGISSGGPRAVECIRFRLDSEDVKHVGWWQLREEYVLWPVKKWRRAPRFAGAEIGILNAAVR